MSVAVTELQDREARLAACTVFDRPVLLEAGAGTGKTATLVARVIAWTTGPGWLRGVADAGADADEQRTAACVLDGLCAITFTEAAAAEMSTRIAEALVRQAAGEAAPGIAAPADAETRARAASLLIALDHLRVSTIHAFCRRLLGRHPLEAGLHPSFTVDAEGAEVEAVVREVIERWARRAYGESADADAITLAADGFGPRELAASLAALAVRGLRAEAFAGEVFAAAAVLGTRDRLSAAIDRFRSAGGGLLSGVRKGGVALEVLAALDRTAAVVVKAGASVGGLDEICAAVRDGWTREARTRLRQWSRGAFNDTEGKALGDDLGPVHEAAAELAAVLEELRGLRPLRLEAARRVLRPLLIEVEEELRARGVETFDALLRDAAALLSAHPQVAVREREQLRQLLVDEFQDTDRLQCEILRRLVLDTAPAERPGLFLVGDPKQSIYGWRGADLAAYEEFARQIEEAGGERHRLVVNFRSVPAILDEVERVMRPVMLAESGLQPAYEPLVACAEQSGRPGFVDERRAPIEYWVSWDAPQEGAGSSRWRTRAGDAVAIEARALAADIASLHHGGVPWREIAVLLRGTSDLDVYLYALRDADVPYVVERDRGFYRRREVIEASALVRAVLDPADHVALLAWLRSAAVGVPDAALEPLWSRRFPDRVTELVSPEPDALAVLRSLVEEAAAEVPADIPGIAALAGWPEILLDALATLATLRAASEREPTVAFVERLRTATLLEATAAAQGLGAYRLANLDRFFRALIAGLEGDPQQLARALRGSFAAGRVGEEGRPREAAADAVSVMTIHKAKGLDFGHVYLVQMHKRSPFGREEPCDAEELDGRLEYRLCDAPTPGWREVSERRQRVGDAELIRTLYVAMTRAKQRLVLVGNWAAGAPSTRASSHVDLLTARQPAPPSLDWLGSKLAAQHRFFEDQAAARWVFPALIEEQGIAPGWQAPLAAPPIAEIERDGALLAARALEAADRAARPFAAAASAASHASLDELLQGGTSGGRATAMAVGSALHRLLEELDLGADVAAELGAARARLASLLDGALPERLVGDARVLAGELLDSLLASPLPARLAAVAPHVVARELPVLLGPEGDHGPVGYLSGTIDLVYRDPAGGALVVADYKTDRVRPGEIEERAEIYRPQLEAYGRALQQALALATPPRLELWFLAAGAVVVLPRPADP